MTALRHGRVRGALDGVPLSKNHQVQAQVIHGEITSVTRANYLHSRASTVDMEPRLLSPLMALFRLINATPTLFLAFLESSF